MPGTPDELPRLYTPAEVAEAMRCSKWWVLEQVRQRRVPFCEVAGSYRFRAEHYAAILRLLEVWPEEDAAPASPQRAVRVAVEDSAGHLQARVPRRLREVPSIDTAA